MKTQPNSEELKQKKVLRKTIKTAEIERKEAAKQNNLKQEWIEWAKKFDTEDEAVVEGVQACEKLARDLEVKTRSNSADYYMYMDAEQDKDLMRLAQFDQLKNLWIKRNSPNIVSIKAVEFNKQVKPYQFGFNEFWEDTFFHYLENIQLYLCELKINDKEYIIFVTKVPANLDNNLESVSLPYGKALTKQESQSINVTFHKLVPIVECGARIFWQKYWSKSENKLLPETI